MSSAVLDAAASITGGVLSIMIRLNPVRLVTACPNTSNPNRPEDYTVPHRIHGAAVTAARGKLCPLRTQENQRQPSRNLPGHRLRYFSEHQNPIVDTVRELVEIESPSDNKPAVDRI